MKSTPNNIVVISDMHVGSRVSLMPPKFRLHDGGTVNPSKLQRALYAWWREFWDEFVPFATKGEPYLVVNNGDVVDGIPHGSVAHMSAIADDQCGAAVELLRPILGRKQVAGYAHVKGTESHTAKSGESEERVARALGAIPDKNGSYSRWELWKTIGDGRLIHFLHHVGTTGSASHEASAVNAELTAEMVEAARWGDEAPSMIVRSHRHRSMELRLPGPKGWISAVVTPAWQAKTPFCYKIPGARLAPSQIGGIVLRYNPKEGALYTIPFVKHIGREKPE